MINKFTYIRNHSNFTDNIIHKKRLEIISIIKKKLMNGDFKDILDIGTTEDTSESSNLIIKSLKDFESYKSISNQKITSNFFSKKLQKSITEDFSLDEIEMYKSDVVVSNATIEHVGSDQQQLQMLKNIIKLTKKIFIVITPNRLHPLEFHSKIPFIHWLPKKTHRKILSIIGMSYLSKEENMNLLKTSSLVNLMKNLNNIEYEIRYVKFLMIKSNIILIGKKLDNI